MKNYKTIIAAVVAGLACTAITSQAALVTGALGFTGVANLTGSLPTATGVTSWVNPTVNGAPTGTFGLYLTSAATVTFNAPWVFTSGLSPLWTVSQGGETFVFNLLASGVSSEDADGVVVKGSGTVTGSGTTAYDATQVNWFFSTQAGVTTFSASSVVPVPEPSTVVAGALMLLPFGIGAIRSLRKDRKA